MSLPDETHPTALPEDKQDASLAGTYAARPGARDAPPAGVTTTNIENPSTAPFVDSTPGPTVSDKVLSESVKNSLDSVADSTPSTQYVTEQLPSAQAAANAVKTGASSLLAGISNLALGVNDATVQNAADSHPESEQARDADDFHIPGGFEDETSDREDIAAVQRSVQSASQAIPSVQAVKETVPGVDPNSNTAGGTSGTLAEQVQTGARSVQDQAQKGVDLVKEQLPGQQDQTETKNEQINKDDIKSQLQDENINSVGETSTTNQLAGQVPLESRGLPEVVKDSQRQAGGAAPLDEPAFGALEVSSTTAQLAGQVPLEPRSVPTVVTDSQRQTGASPEAAANPQAVQDKRHLEKELLQEVPTANITSVGATSTTNQLAGQIPLEPRGVPQIVADSQKRADVSPEASANAEAVREKKQVEQELRREVPKQTSKDNTPVKLGEALAGGLTAAGAATASAATSARQTAQEATGTDPVSVLPASAQRAIDGDAAHPNVLSASTSGAVPHVVQASQQRAGVSPEASANPEAVREKSQFERELQHEVPKQGDSSISENLGSSVAGGLAAAGAAVAGAATYAREKTAETTGSDPVSVLPVSTQQAIDGDDAVKTTAHVPQVVSDSQHAAGLGPEAAANPTAVREKSAVERELKREVSPEPATSGDQGIAGTLAGGTAAAGSAAANAATYARQKTTEVTGTDPVSVLPETAQRSIDQTSSANAGLASSSPHDNGGGSSVLPSGDSDASSSVPRVGGESSSGHSSLLGGVDLRSGVHNGVVGDHLDDTSSNTARRTPSREAETGTAAPVAHISSVRNVDLSAGVKNTVVGSGAQQQDGQEALDRSGDV